MQDRLTITRPPSLGAALGDAVRGVCALSLDVTPGSLPLLDARLACGDFESVLTLMRDTPPAPALPLFLARCTLWTGDLQSAHAAWPAVLSSLEDVLANDDDEALRRATCVELARTATDLGDAQLAAKLHGIARGIDESVRLMMQVDPDSTVVCGIALGTLGIDPDATRGRLRLRPRLDIIDDMHARHIRFGDASVSMNATRDGANLIIRVEQESGSIPITLLLEPFVTAPGAAEVDGVAADLTPREAAGRTILPVQLVLDDTRTLTVRLRDDS